MAILSQTASKPQTAKKKVSFMESQRLAKQRAYEKQSKKKKISLLDISLFTNQLASMLTAGLPLVTALEALQEQMSNPVFKIIIRDVRIDVSSGSSFSQAIKKYPRAFPNLLTSMVEAGEAAGALTDILQRTSEYFENTVALVKKVKSAMTYPIAVIILAVVIVIAMLRFVVPEFAKMFRSFGKELPAPTQLLIDSSDFIQEYLIHVIVGLIAVWKITSVLLKTPRGRRVKDIAISKLPIMGNLNRKVSVSRFCRTYAILLRSGVPILRSLEICSSASNNTFIEQGCSRISRQISAGGQLSDVVDELPYFPKMVRHMARAGEQTGNIDGMMTKISDFFDMEVNNIVDSLTSLMEPILMVVIGVIIGSIVIAMFMPIFEMTTVAF